MLGPANQEILMRARADLRLGIPIVLENKENAAIIAPIEVLNESRLDQLKVIDKNSFILITTRRAKTLKCPIYDENFVRIAQANSLKLLHSRQSLILFLIYATLLKVLLTL